jgi:hypothetical protein
MATYIFPTVADIGGAGKGKTFSEQNTALWMNRSTDGTNEVTSGLNPITSANLTLTVPTGEAMIAGYRITIDTASTVSIGASTTTWLYLTLTRDGSNNVTGTSFTTSTTTSVPTTDQVKIAKVTSSGTAITMVDCYTVQWINIGEPGAPAMAPGWGNYGSPYPQLRFTKRSGVVYIEGVVKTGTLGTTVFTLPAGYRPNGQLYFIAPSNTSAGLYIVMTDGIRI